MMPPTGMRFCAIDDPSCEARQQNRMRGTLKKDSFACVFKQKTSQRNAQALFILQRCFHNPNTGKTMLTWDKEVTSTSQISFDGGLPIDRSVELAPPSAPLSSFQALSLVAPASTNSTAPDSGANIKHRVNAADVRLVNGKTQRTWTKRLARCTPHGLARESSVTRVELGMNALEFMRDLHSIANGCTTLIGLTSIGSHEETPVPWPSAMIDQTKERNLIETRRSSTHQAAHSPGTECQHRSMQSLNTRRHHSTMSCCCGGRSRIHGDGKSPISMNRSLPNAGLECSLLNAPRRK